MAASTQISNYIAYGTHAARPVTPSVATGVSSMYYETDTGNVYMWSGAWQLVNPVAASAVSLVQTATACAAAPVMGVAPSSGNLLIAFQCGSIGSTATGWTQEWQDAGGSTETTIYWKIAGAGESTTQNPSTSLTPAGMTVFEFAHWNNFSYAVGFNNNDSTGVTHTITPHAFKTAGIICGVNFNEANANQPTGYTPAGVVLDSAATSVTPRAQQAWHLPSPTVGSNSIVATYAASQNSRMSSVFVN